MKIGQYNSYLSYINTAEKKLKINNTAEKKLETSNKNIKMKQKIIVFVFFYEKKRILLIFLSYLNKNQLFENVIYWP